jgi:hypothetical protein
MMHGNWRRRFSTLEALVAFAVLSLGLLGAVQSISAGGCELAGIGKWTGSDGGAAAIAK